MARLAYCQLETSFAFDRDRIRKVLGRIQFTDCKFFETATEPDGGGSRAFLALDGDNILAVLSFRGTDKDDPTDLMDDLNALPQPWQAGGKVHSGFAKALQEVWPGVEAALARVQPMSAPVHWAQSGRGHGHTGIQSAKAEGSLYHRLSARGRPGLRRSVAGVGQPSLCRLLRSRNPSTSGSVGIHAHPRQGLLH